MEAQTISGMVYDADASVKGVKVYNSSRHTMTYSDERGEYKIAASVNDTLTFKSLFHNEKSYTLKATDFEDFLIIELKKIVNTLDEVYITDAPKFKEFDPVEANETVQQQFKADIKNNPHLYQKSPSGNMDLVAIAGMVAGLFKNKNSSSAPNMASYEDLSAYFKTDTFFTNTLLNEDLNIPETYHPLFLEYCSTKRINTNLLTKENRMLLLDALFNYSAAFLKLVESQKKE
ncbi:hypothetical protein [Lacinutrix undariae]